MSVIWFYKWYLYDWEPILSRFGFAIQKLINLIFSVRTRRLIPRMLRTSCWQTMETVHSYLREYSSPPARLISLGFHSMIRNIFNRIILISIWKIMHIFSLYLIYLQKLFSFFLILFCTPMYKKNIILLELNLNALKNNFAPIKVFKVISFCRSPLHK